MRLTAMYVCGTLLAFSSLPWIRAEEGVLLGDHGFGPCAATLKPEGACRQGQRGSTCPYLFSLPPLTVHLPHLRELEDIMQDLQILKDSVDELRKMCAGCQSHNDRGCGRQTEREHEKQTEGKSTRADVRNWMNVRPEETERDFKLECGNDAVKVEKTDTEKSLMLEEEERHKWETDRKGNEGAVKEKEREESLSEVGEKDGKAKKDGARRKDAPDQKRMPTAGNTRTVDVTSENVFETGHREVDRIKDALKGNLKGFQEDKLENEDEKKILTNAKNKEKTKEESNIYVWQEDINKTKRTEASDKTKMSENHGDHTNEEREEQKGETREEMETGIKVGRNNENPKQTESAGRTEEEKTIKEGEVDDKDREIKAESEQRDGDGELSSRKTTERTDFFPISPTPLSITRSTSWLDSSKVTTLTSSLPSPSFPSSTLSSITDVSHETKGVYGLTKSSSHGAADVSKTQRPDATTTEKPRAGLQGHERSTTTTHPTLHITASPNVADRSRWAPKKNISSNIRSVVKPPPGPGLKAGQKLKPGIKPEAEQKLKNLKNDRKPNQAPVPDKKPKYNQKQKPAPHKPTSEKPKAGRDPEQTQITQPDRRPPPYILVPNKNQKNNLTRQQDLTLQNKLPFHKPKPPQRPPSVQKATSQNPQPVNTTHSDEHPLGNKDLESDKTPGVDQNSKPEKKVIYPFKTNKQDQKKITEKTPEGEEKTKPDDKIEQNPKPEQNLKPKPNQKHQTESEEISGENPSQDPESKPDSTPGAKTTPDRVHATSDQMKNSSREMTETKPESIQEPESKRGSATSQTNQKPLSESVRKPDKNHSQKPESKPALKLGQKFISGRVNATSDQINHSSQAVAEIKHKLNPIKGPKGGTATSKPDQKLLAENKSVENPSQEAKSIPDLTPERKITTNIVHETSDQMNQFNMENTEIKDKPERVQEPESKRETAKPKPNQKHPADNVETSDGNPIQEPELYQVNATPIRMPESSQEILDIKPKPDQDFNVKKETTTSKPNEKPLTGDKSIQIPLHKPTFTPDLKPEKKITSDGVNANESSQEVVGIKQQPKPSQEPESRRDTTTSQPNHVFLTESVKKSEKNPYEEPESNTDTQSGQKITFDQVNMTSNQMNTSKQEIPQIKHESKLVQKPESKNEAATSKPDPKLLTSDENSLKEQEFNPDIKSGKRLTFDQVNANSDQMNKSIQGRPTIKYRPKPIQKPDPKGKTATPKHNQKPVDRSDQIPSHKPKLNPNLTPGQRITSDRGNVTSDPMKKPTQEIKIKPKPKPFQEPKFESETGASKPLAEFLDESEDVPPNEPKFNLDLTPEQKIPSDLVNVTSDQMKKPKQEIKIKPKPKPSQEPKFESETGASKPLAEFEDGSEDVPPNEPKFNLDLTPEQKIPSDLVNVTSDQINKPSQEIKQKPKPTQEPESKSETASSRPDQKVVTAHKLQKPKSNQKLTPGQTPAFDQNPKPGRNVSNINKKPKPGSEPKSPPKYPKAEAGLKIKPDADHKMVHTPQTNSSLRAPRPGQKLNLKPVSLYEKVPTAASNRTSKPKPPFQFRPPTRHTSKPGPKLIQKPKQPVQPAPSPKTKTALHPSKTNGLPSENIPNSQTDVISPSGLGKHIAEVTHSPRETSSTSTRKTITLGPKTSNSLKAEHLPRPYTHAEDFTLSSNSRIVSDLRPQTASRPPSIPMTTRPNTVYSGTLHRVFTSTSPGPTQQSSVPKSDSLFHHVKETAPETPVLLSSSDTTSTPSPDLRSETSTTSDPEPFAAERSTPSARELRVKINQVVAFVNNSLNPNGRPGGGLPKELPKGSQSGSLPGRINGRLPTSLSSKAPRDCSDLLLRGKTTSGVYLVTPDLRSRSFPVFCDMELGGGGWTLLQRRQDGSVSFNRTWVEYQSGFGVLDGGEFWLGNNMIHLLTRDRDMVLRVELEDFDGVTGFAQYELFRVAGERLRYRLTVDGYSGTAGDALRFSKRYDHNNKAFTTPDRDHDRYPSGSCGAYYSSGWWFDACMAANLNGRYYNGKYKGVRDGIFWGTWYNISEEYYPTNERQSFKSVRMMIRPKAFVP